MYRSDPHYRYLHDKIADYFVELLFFDVELLKKSRTFKEFSLASVFCPEVDSFMDKSTLLCESIARRLFPRNLNLEYQSMEDVSYVYTVRERLREEVLNPLLLALEVSEVYKSAEYKCRWSSGVCNKESDRTVFDRTVFILTMDRTSLRFDEAVCNVGSCDLRIASDALLPFEITLLLNYNYGQVAAELQWKRLVIRSTAAEPNNCIAIISGIMKGIQQEAAVSLGLLISELSGYPWKGKFITFSENPELRRIQGVTLKERIEAIRKCPGNGMKIDFYKVLDHILEAAVEGKLKKENVIKTLYVFSNNGFDEASVRDWDTDLKSIKNKYNEKGYAMPEIVFWNLSKLQKVKGIKLDEEGVVDMDVPVVKMEAGGLTKLTGSSTYTLELFLDGELMNTCKALLDEEAEMAKALH